MILLFVSSARHIIACAFTLLWEQCKAKKKCVGLKSLSFIWIKEASFNYFTVGNHVI